MRLFGIAGDGKAWKPMPVLTPISRRVGSKEGGKRLLWPWANAMMVGGGCVGERTVGGGGAGDSESCRKHAMDKHPQHGGTHPWKQRHPPHTTAHCGGAPSVRTSAPGGTASASRAEKVLGGSTTGEAQVGLQGQ